MPNELGIVGWEDDSGDSVELGDSTNDGNALVKVQLFRGRVPDRELDQTRSQGRQILCQIAGHVSIPATGARVMVATPDGLEDIPGAGVIIANLDNNWKARGNMGQGELVLQIPGSPALFAIRKNGTIILKTTDSGGNDVTLTFGPTGLFYQSQWVSSAWDFSGIRTFHVPSGAGFFAGGMAKLPPPFDALGAVPGFARMSATVVKADGSLVLLGPDLPGGAQVWQPVAWGPDPGPGPLLVTGVKSSSVKCAP